MFCTNAHKLFVLVVFFYIWLLYFNLIYLGVSTITFFIIAQSCLCLMDSWPVISKFKHEAHGLQHCSMLCHMLQNMAKEGNFVIIQTYFFIVSLLVKIYQHKYIFLKAVIGNRQNFTLPEGWSHKNVNNMIQGRRNWGGGSGFGLPPQLWSHGGSAPQLFIWLGTVGAVVFPSPHSPYYIRGSGSQRKAKWEETF